MQLARWSLYCVLAVVLVFGATIAYAQLVLEPIEERTDALTENALPSVRELANARAALGRMQSNPADIGSARRDLDAALVTYENLPEFPGERPLTEKADETVAILEEHIDEGGNTAALSPLIRNADDALYRLVTFNIDHAITAASQIDTLKARSRAVSLALSLVSLLTALVASGLVWRSARRQTRLDAEHSALLESRAAELEAYAGRIAHDLKDPLGTLALRLALMKQEMQQEHVDKAIRQVERVDHLIEGLLTHARGGPNPPPGARAQLRDIVEEAAEQLRPRAQAVDARLEIDPIPARELACTPGALLSVLSNLMSNAIRYVGEGRKPLRQVAVHVDDREHEVHVEVADTGPGLSAGAERRAFQSSGLATVKRIVEGCGGRVGVRSTVGKGTVFWFDLPKAEGA